jgi:hypothetical protein
MAFLPGVTDGAGSPPQIMHLPKRDYEATYRTARELDAGGGQCAQERHNAQGRRQEARRPGTGVWFWLLLAIDCLIDHGLARPPGTPDRHC